MKKILVLFFVFVFSSQAFALQDDLVAKKAFSSSWSFKGKIDKKFDKAQLKRGYQVYKDICSNCHSMNYLHYKDLKQVGLKWAKIKEISAEFEFEDGFDDEGEIKVRKGMPSDAFKKPYPNEKYARFVNFGALPPDLSLMAKARKRGVDYINSFLSGFDEKPENQEDISYDKTYNPYFEGRQTMMPPPLMEGILEYEDETEASLKNMRKDVATFLAWAADPHMEKRLSLGWKVLTYCVVLLILLMLLKKVIWEDVEK
jgi:cytochrome c1